MLRLSNSEAFYRITAARIARRFPLVFTLVEQRRLHLTAVCLLRDYLTPENHEELLRDATHKTKWQIQELLAKRFLDLTWSLEFASCPRRAQLRVERTRTSAMRPLSQIRWLSRRCQIDSNPNELSHASNHCRNTSSGP